MLIPSALAEVTDGINTLNFSSIIENFLGGSGNNSITGNTAANRLEGGAGNDTIDGGLGNDTLVGGLNDDTYLFSGSFGTDTIIENLGQGNDTVDISGTSGNATVNLTSNATSSNITVGTNSVRWSNSEIENLISGSGSDTIRGTNVANRIEAGAGNDTVFGAAGNDTILGGSGNDTLRGETGNDLINGGIGDDILNGDMGGDTYQFNNNWGSDTIQDMVYDNVYTDNTIDFSNSTNAVSVKLEGSTLYDEVTDGLGSKVNWTTGNVISRVIGSQGNDTFIGNKFNNFFDGHTGDDWMEDFLGNFGTDTIQDSAGEDTLDLREYYHYTNQATDAVITFSGKDLIIDIANTVSSVQGKGRIIIKNYFSDNTQTAPGTNFIEHILFANKEYNPFNQAPTDILLASGGITPENNANGSVIGQFTAVDPNSNDTFTYSLINNAGGRFAINGTTGELTVANGSLLNFEAATSHNVTVRVTDSNGSSYDKQFAIGVTNINEAPIAINGVLSSVPENSANGTSLGILTGIDPDAGDTLTFSLTDNAGGRFTINSTTGEVTVVDGSQLNFEASTSHNITVRVTDAGGLSYEKQFTIGVTNVNEAPTAINGVLSTVPENSTNGTSLGILTGADPDAGDTLTFSLTDNAGGRFAINSSTGEVTVANGTLLDFETTTSHNITVRVTDAGGLSYDKQFTIGVTNVNEAPTAINGTLTSIVENSANGTSLGILTGTDPDAGDTLTFSLSDSAGGRFAINSTTGEVTVADGTQLNFEAATSHNITVRVTDAGGLSYEKPFTIGITNVNEAPVLVNNNTEVLDNGQTITLTNLNLLTSDQDNTAGELTYTVTSLTTNGTLELNGNLLGIGSTFTQADLDAGLITYTHDGTSTTIDSFNFTISDGSGGFIGTTIHNININPTPPEANPDQATTTSGGSTTIDVLANDAPGDSDPAVALNPRRVFNTYTDLPNFVNNFSLENSLNSDPNFNPTRVKLGDNYIKVTLPHQCPVEHLVKTAYKLTSKVI